MGSLSNLSVLETRFYNIFQKYYKGIHRKVVEVQVEGFSKIARVYRCYASQVWIGIRMSNGLHLSRKNLSYYEQVTMVEKLEGGC